MGFERQRDVSFRDKLPKTMISLQGQNITLNRIPRAGGRKMPLKNKSERQERDKPIEKTFIKYRSWSDMEILK
jgi:hypothetical protein